MSNELRHPLPPFDQASAIKKVRLAENAWNSREPSAIALAYSTNSEWRNRTEFFHGRKEIIALLTRKWERELDYRLVKELWAYTGNRIAVRFAYEWRDSEHNWYRSYGNENWEFDHSGLMKRRLASINDVQIAEHDRKLKWEGRVRPLDYPELSELGL